MVQELEGAGRFRTGPLLPVRTCMRTGGLWESPPGPAARREGVAAM